MGVETEPALRDLLQCATGTGMRRNVRGEAGRHNCSEGGGGLEGAMATLQRCGVRAGTSPPARPCKQGRCLIADGSKR